MISADDRFYSVREVWDRIVPRAWQSGDPGLLFIDEINRRKQTLYLGPIRATKLCGEQPLLPYEVCNLSINLAAAHTAAPGEWGLDLIDCERLGRTVELAVRFLDDLVEVNNYPTPEIHETLKPRGRNRLRRDGPGRDHDESWCRFVGIPSGVSYKISRTGTTMPTLGGK